MQFNYSELILAAIVAMFTAVHFFVNYRHRNTILLSDISIWLAGCLFGVGPFLSFLFGYRDFPEFSGPLLLTYLSALLFFLGMIISKALFHNTLVNNPQLTQRGQRSPVFYFIDHCREIPFSNLLIVFLSFLGLKLYNFSIGGGVSGFNTLEVNLSKNYFVVILEQVTEPFKFVLLFCGFYLIIRKDKLAWWIAFPVLIFVGLDSFLQGRRSMVFFIIALGFTVFSVQRKVKIRHALFGLVSVILIFSVISPFFLAFRSAGQQARHTEVDDSLVAFLSRGFEEAQQLDDVTIVEKGAHNLSHRFLLVRSYPLTLFEVQQGQSPLLGRAFIQASTSALPRAFRPYEAWINPESYVQMQYGLPIMDVSTSILGHFVADFSVFGGFFGGLFLGLYLNFGTYLSFRIFRSMPVVGMCVFVSLFTLAINTEHNPGFILALPRNLVIMYFLFIGLRLIGFRMKDFGALPQSSNAMLGPYAGGRRIRR